MTKKQLGQFFTSNSSHILQGLEKYIKGKSIVDPFAGAKDLIKWAQNNGAAKVSGFDIDRKLINRNVKYNDSLLNPQKYPFVVTNPPYLYINKASEETKQKYFSRYKRYDDLYQISLASLMDSDEGIFIVPINLFSAENSNNIRQDFFEKFTVDEMNYFTYQVFPDTTYNVIAAHYRLKKESEGSSFTIKTRIFFEDGNVQTRNIEVSREFGWAIGREYIKPILKIRNELRIRRFEERDLRNGNASARLAFGHIKIISQRNIAPETLEILKRNIILLKAIDSGGKNGKIALEDIRSYGIHGLVSVPTSRHMIQLIFDQPISESNQRKLIELFNIEFNKIREQTFSLFLTNYRDKNRKRVSFDFVYKFLNYLYREKIQSKRVGLFAQNNYEQVG